MKYHTTQDGTEIELQDLGLSHLKNIIKWIDRKAADGLTIKMGCGLDAESAWYDESTFFGEDARKQLDYYEYCAELRRRGFYE